MTFLQTCTEQSRPEEICLFCSLFWKITFEKIKRRNNVLVAVNNPQTFAETVFIWPTYIYIIFEKMFWGRMDVWRKDGFVIIKLTCDIKYETSFPLYINKDSFLLKSHLFYEQFNYLFVIFQIFSVLQVNMLQLQLPQSSRLHPCHVMWCKVEGFFKGLRFLGGRRNKCNCHVRFQEIIPSKKTCYSHRGLMESFVAWCIR